MLNGNVAEITAEIVDLLNDTLIEFFGAKRDQELDLISESVGVTLMSLELPIKQSEERSGKLAWKAFAGKCHEGLVDTGIVKSAQRQKDLKAALEKAMFLYASTFKTKKQLKEMEAQ